jgi:hypothetical protein
MIGHASSSIEVPADAADAKERNINRSGEKDNTDRPGSSDQGIGEIRLANQDDRRANLRRVVYWHSHLAWINFRRTYRIGRANTGANHWRSMRGESTVTTRICCIKEHFVKLSRSIPLNIFFVNISESVRKLRTALVWGYTRKTFENECCMSFHAFFVLKKCPYGMMQRRFRMETKLYASETRIFIYVHQNTPFQTEWSPTKSIDDR